MIEKIDSLEDGPFKLALKLLWHLGARVQDLAQLTASMFTLKDGSYQTTYTPEKTKNTGKKRPGIIPKDVYFLMLRLLKEGKVGKDSDVNSKLFARSANTLASWINRKLEKNGFEGHTSHDFRTSLINSLYKQNLTLAQIGSYIGHTKEATTYRYLKDHEAHAAKPVIEVMKRMNQRENIEEAKSEDSFEMITTATKRLPQDPRPHQAVQSLPAKRIKQSEQ